MDGYSRIATRIPRSAPVIGFTCRSSTNPRVRFMIDGRPVQLEVGQAYEINNQKTHSVMNKGDTDRIHFIFDYVPPAAIPPVLRRLRCDQTLRSAGNGRESAR